jgi:hypothetical protein
MNIHRAVGMVLPAMRYFSPSAHEATLMGNSR